MFLKSHRVLLRKSILLYKHPSLKIFRIYKLNYFCAAVYCCYGLLVLVVHCSTAERQNKKNAYMHREQHAHTSGGGYARAL